MRIHIDKIKETGLKLTFSEPAENFSVLPELVRNNECEFLAPVETRLQATRIGDIIKVDGRSSTIVRLACDRCLEKYDARLSNSFSLTYSRDVTAGPDDDGEEIELSSEDLGIIGFHGDEIDFHEAVQEHVVLALPLQSLCSPDCKGLCPQCGQDLNISTCTCEKLVPSGKFAALRKLKLKDQ